MLNVERIGLETVRMRLKEPFRISSGAQEERRVILVRLFCGDAVGLGECVASETPDYSYETVDTAMWMLERHLAPAVLGLEFPTAVELGDKLKRAVRGHPMARAALEMAAWHIQAQLEDTSLSRLLGGEREAVEVGVSIGLQPSIDALLEKVRGYVERGYRRVKMKIAPGHDLEWVRAVREAWPELPLMVDANAAYAEDDIPRLRRLDGLGLMMIEQPFADDDLLSHAQLQNSIETPVCLDEAITSLARCETALRLNAAGIINIKPGRVGGHAESIRIHDRCASEGVPVWCGGMLETGIGRAHNIALASLPNFKLPGDISASDRYWERDVIDPPFTLGEDGTLPVPGRTGLGVDIDETFLDRIRMDQVMLELE